MHKVSDDPVPGQIEPIPPLVIVNREEEYKVQRVEDSRVFRHQLQYLVKWNGYNERSWEPAVNVDGLQALDVLHTEQPARPGSTTS